MTHGEGLIRLSRTVVSSVLLLAFLVVMVTPTMDNASATYSINKSQSGLVSSDSLTTGNTTAWTFGGTASVHNYYEDSQGLHIGVQSPQSGQDVNYYVASAGAGAHLFHSVITIPYTSVADGVFNPGLYVEGSNYVGIVGCQAYADRTGYYWIVQSTIDAGSTWTTLYAPPVDSLPQTDDCTVISNGTNYLKVYIGDNVVFSSSTMNLKMQTPLHAFIQADTSSSSMDYATYSNYYTTTNENVEVTNNPSNAATVQIVDTAGNVLATAPVSSGTATLNVGQYHFPLSDTINVYDSNNAIIASSPATIYGGDIFSVNSGTSTAPQPPTGLTAIAILSSQINLSWTTPSSNGGSAITGYKIEHSTDGGTTWSTIQSNTGTTATTYSNTGLASSTTYTYRVSAINAVGTSLPSGIASATTQPTSTGAAITINSVQSTSGTILSSPYQITLANVNAGTGNNRLLVVGIESNNNNAASVTFGGVQMTQAVSSFTNNDAEFWYLVNPSGTGNVVATMSGSTSAVVGAYSISGVDQTDPIPTKATQQNTVASSPSISITTKFSNSMILDLPAIYGGVTLGSPTCTQDWDVNVPSAITGASSSLIDPSPGSATCSWTASSNDMWDDIAVEVKAAASSVPGAPTGLTATAISSSQINLSWTAPSSNGGSAITGYKIERSPDGNTWSALVANTGNTSTTYSDTGLASSTAYTYRVSAINAVGTSSPSNTASATTQSNITAPQPPTGLTVIASSFSQINLSWTSSSNGGSAITGYKIEHSTDGGTTWNTVQSNTGSTSTTYSDTGLASSTTYTYRVSAINAVGTSLPSNTASATTISPIKQVKSGLVISDSLTNETETQQQLQASHGYWGYGGDAPAENAPYTISRDIQGFHNGAQAPSNGTWAGYYSVTQNTNAYLFHAVITTPVNSIPSNSNWYENGLYVQTFEPGPVNYVACTSLTGNGYIQWVVFSATGNYNQVTNESALFVDTSPNQPLTRDCTIITNGQNFLQVYLDGNLVVNRTNLNLQMQEPFNAYLEPQTSYAGQLLNGTFTNYYSTANGNVTVNNLPTNAARVDLDDSSGDVLATSPVSGDIAILDVASYDFPLSGTIKAYDSNNVLITSTSGSVSIYGGDVYSVK